MEIKQFSKQSMDHGTTKSIGINGVRLGELLHRVIEVTKVAAEFLVGESKRPDGLRGCGSETPIDLEIETFLRKELIALFPAGFIGEETGRIESPSGEYWIVDPHDGTSAFLEGYGGTSVSVALLRNSTPVLGVVCAPLSPDMSFDCIAWAEGMPSLLRNGREIRPKNSDRPLSAQSMVFLNHRSAERPVSSGTAVAPGRFITLPSIAYRLARVAAGDGDASVSLNGPCSHDYAAGHALLRGAGMVLLDQSGSPVTYAADGTSQVKACFGGMPSVAADLSKRRWTNRRETKRGWRQPPDITHYQIDPAVLQRARGCLMGQIIGDSLGSRVEFQAAKWIRKAFPEGVRDLADGGTWNTLAGQPTDDSELALALARSLVANRRYDADAVAEAYGRWYMSKPFDIGSTTAAALSMLHYVEGDYAATAQKAANPKSQANGSLMRVSPIGIWARFPKVAAHYAAEDSRLTHPNETCVAACQIYAAAICAGIQYGTLEAMIDEANLVAQHVPSDLIRDTYLNALKGYGPKEFDGDNQGWVLIAFQNAFRHLAAGTPIDTALIETVGMGGDTDTNAAITGALLGSLLGIKAIPQRWIRPVLACRPHKALNAPRPRPEEYWPDDVLDLAATLVTCAKPFVEPFGSDE